VWQQLNNSEKVCAQKQHSGLEYFGILYSKLTLRHLALRQTEHRNLIAQKACITLGHPVTSAVLRPAIKETHCCLPAKTTDNGYDKPYKISHFTITSC
jgi:hypothetical protein